jgi:hypothetical protein
LIKKEKKGNKSRSSGAWGGDFIAATAAEPSDVLIEKLLDFHSRLHHPRLCERASGRVVNGFAIESRGRFRNQ